MSYLIMYLCIGLGVSVLSAMIWMKAYPEKPLDYMFWWVTLLTIIIWPLYIPFWIWAYFKYK